MQSFGASKEFLFNDDIEWEVVGEGVRRKIMAYDDKAMLVKVEFEKGSIGYVHEHYHTQVTYIASGAFEVTISGKTNLMKTGDSFYIPPHELHGVVCIEAGSLIDVFSPIREDFMKM